MYRSLIFHSLFSVVLLCELLLSWLTLFLALIAPDGQAIVIALSALVPGHSQFAHTRTWWAPPARPASGSVYIGGGGDDDDESDALRVRDLARVKLCGVSKEMVCHLFLVVLCLLLCLLFLVAFVCCFAALCFLIYLRSTCHVSCILVLTRSISRPHRILFCDL